MDIKKGVEHKVFQPVHLQLLAAAASSGSMLHEQTAETLGYLPLDTLKELRPAGRKLV
tara:strand:- start:761 stop:934 length:174 start_codon:yes stop_codon:yes gene_type:complete